MARHLLYQPVRADRHPLVELLPPEEHTDEVVAVGCGRGVVLDILDREVELVPKMPTKRVCVVVERPPAKVGKKKNLRPRLFRRTPRTPIVSKEVAQTTPPPDAIPEKVWREVSGERLGTRRERSDVYHAARSLPRPRTMIPLPIDPYGLETPTFPTKL